MCGELVRSPEDFPWPRLTELRALDVSNNPLSDLSGLSSLSRLEQLHLDSLDSRSCPTSKRRRICARCHFAESNRLARTPRPNPQSDLGFSASNTITTVAPLVGTSFRGTLVMTSNPLDCALEAPHQAALVAQGATSVGTMCL